MGRRRPWPLAGRPDPAGRPRGRADRRPRPAPGPWRPPGHAGPPGVGKSRLGLAAVSAVRRHFPDGVFFVDLAPLASPDLAALGAAGHVIGSHTMTHAALPSLPAEDVRRELQESRLRILHALGTVAQHLAPPYGKVSVRMAELAKECGYLTICSTARGVIGPRELESGVLRRVALRRDRPRLGRFWSVRPAAGSRT